VSGEVARRQLHQRVVLRLHVLACASAGAPASVAAEAAVRLGEVLAELFEVEPGLLLQHRAGVMFLNGARLVPDALTLAAVEGLGPRLYAARLDGVVIEPGVTTQELLALAGALARPGDAPPESARVHGIPAEANELAAAQPRGTHLKAVYVTKLLLEALPPSPAADLRAQKQLLQLLAETLLVHPRAIELLEALDQRRGPALAHQVQVAAHALLLGRALNLAPGALGELGVFALFPRAGVPAADARGAAQALQLPGAVLYPRIVDVAGRFVAAAAAGVAGAFAQLRAAAGGDGVQHALIERLELALAAVAGR
jgi:hypothetical protein